MPPLAHSESLQLDDEETAVSASAREVPVSEDKIEEMMGFVGVKPVDETFPVSTTIEEAIDFVEVYDKEAAVPVSKELIDEEGVIMLEDSDEYKEDMLDMEMD